MKSLKMSCWLVFTMLFWSACTPKQESSPVVAYVDQYEARTVSAGFGSELTLDEAESIKRDVIAELERRMGPAIGYKAGFTSEAVQQRFGVSSAAWGTMFDGLILESGSTLPATFGAKPQYEADLLAVVSDAGLADATTPLEALEHISFVLPFIELPDTMIEGQPGGHELIAVNIAFRGGVLGTRVPVEATPAFLDALGDMTVVMKDDGGNELGRSNGAALMGNPINAAMWLARQLRLDGIELKEGDLLSLGGFFPPAGTAPGLGIEVSYEGLPGNPSVSIYFE